MKKIWNIRKKDEAVSPVIATILMVAITVVLAAVLYVMVIGFGTSGGSTPAGSWNSVAAQTTTTVKLVFGSSTKTIAPMDVKFLLKNNAGTVIATFAFTAAPIAAMTNLTSGTWYCNYNDMNYQGNAVSAGDYLLIGGLTTKTSYTLQVYHIPTDAIMSMTGTSAAWTTP